MWRLLLRLIQVLPFLFFNHHYTESSLSRLVVAQQSSPVCLLHRFDQTANDSIDHISPVEVAQFTPINKITVWFEQNIKTSTMMVVDKSYVHNMDFTHATEQTTTYTDEGTWVDGNGKAS